MPAVKYPGLQAAVFEPGDLASLHGTFWLMRFPAKWKARLLTLAGGPGSDRVSIPIASLNRVLTALVPDLVHVARYATRGEDPVWLFSGTPVAREAIFAITAAWVRAFGWSSPASLEQALAAMSPSDLHWEEFSVDYARQLRLTGSSEQEERGLANLAVFRLLPQQIAARLTLPGMVCDHAGYETSAFRRCPAEEGAAIMSWPPHRPADKPFSFTIGLSVQTLPLDQGMRLYAHFGVRRWVHRTPVLDTRSHHSVYINPSVPWVTGVTYSPSLQRAGIRLRIEGNGEQAVRRAVWSDLLAQVLRELGAAGYLDLPESIRTNPTGLLDRESGGAALVYREGMYTFPGRPPRSHPASPGLALIDRPRLLEWAASEIMPALRLSSPLPRSDVQVFPALHKTPDKDAVRAAARLRAAIRDATGAPKLNVEIYYDTRQILDQAISELQDQLGVKFRLPEDNSAARVSAGARTSELDITLAVQPVGALGADLEPNPRLRSIIERLHQAVQYRGDLVRRALPVFDPAVPAVALVEIAGKDKYKGANREKDPKFAVRHGFNLADRLTQFIEPPTAVAPAPDLEINEETTTDPDSERLRSSWRDLWRQLGVRADPLPPAEAGLSPARLLAFYIVRQNQTRTWGATRQVPIAVLMDADGTNIQVKAPGTGEWQPLWKAQLAVGRAHVMGGQVRKPEEITAFFHEILTQDLDSSEPLLLLTAAQNCRPGWKFLNNSELAVDVFRFGSRAAQPIAEFPGFRHVRVRTEDGNETPEGYAVNETEKGHAGALWKTAHRIWFSTADKPPTASGTVRYSSMVESTEKRDGSTRPAQPGARVWNHQLLEVAAVGLQVGDDAESWAALAHDLRWAAPHYRHATTLPWPLHLAQLIGEYIVPVRMIEEIEAAGGGEASD
jgi:RNase H domain-containing protein/argonaute-like protein/MID domain-containing protein